MTRHHHQARHVQREHRGHHGGPRSHGHHANHGWLSSVDHTFKHGYHAINHEIKKGTHKIKHEVKHAEKAVKHDGHVVQQTFHHAQKSASHAMKQAEGSVKHRIAQTLHGISSVERGSVKDLTDAAAAIEHGGSQAVGIAESTAIDAVHTGQKAAGVSAQWMKKTGESLWKTTKHDVNRFADYEKEAWSMARNEASNIYHDAESAASTAWGFLWPGNWSFGEWILLGGGGLLATYLVLRTAPAVGRAGVRGAEAVAPYAAEAAPLLLV